MHVACDKKDRRLLYYLSRNARESNTQLAKKLSLSKNAVKYRIERLRKHGIIKKFASVVDLKAIGLNTCTLLLKFNEDIYERQEIKEHFVKHPFTDWVVSLSGNWDLLVEFICRDLEHAYSLLEELFSSLGEAMNTHQTFFSFNTIKVEHLVQDFYGDLEVEELAPKERRQRKNAVDVIDRKILHTLNQDSSLSYVQIAEKLGTSMDVARQRTRRLVENGILIKCFPEVSLNKLGYTEYLQIIKMKNLTAEKIKKIKSIIREHPNITYAFFDTVTLNLVFICAFRSVEGIDRLTRSLRKLHSDVIEKQEYMLVKEQLKFDLFPAGLLAPGE